MVKFPNLTYQDEIDVSSSHFLADLINPIGDVLLLRKPDNEGATLNFSGDWIHYLIASGQFRAVCSIPNSNLTTGHNASLSDS